MFNESIKYAGWLFEWNYLYCDQWHCVLLLRLTLNSIAIYANLCKCNTASSPFLNRAPCLAVPSWPPAARPHVAWTAPAPSADCSQTAPCTETNIAAELQTTSDIVEKLNRIIVKHSSHTYCMYDKAPHDKLLQVQESKSNTCRNGLVFHLTEPKQ